MAELVLAGQVVQRSLRFIAGLFLLRGYGAVTAVYLWVIRTALLTLTVPHRRAIK